MTYLQGTQALPRARCEGISLDIVGLARMLSVSVVLPFDETMVPHLYTKVYAPIVHTATGECGSPQNKVSPGLDDISTITAGGCRSILGCTAGFARVDDEGCWRTSRASNVRMLLEMGPANQPVGRFARSPSSLLCHSQVEANSVAAAVAAATSEVRCRLPMHKVLQNWVM